MSNNVHTKRFLCLFLSILMISIVPITALAEGTDSNKPAYGILTSEDGKQFLIEGRLCDSMQTCAGNEATITYEYTIPVSAVRATNSSTTVDSPDDGYVSHIYLTLNYQTQNTPTEYLLTGVSGRWTIDDPNVAVLSTSLTYGYSGWFPAYASQNNTIKNVSNPFSYSTGFSSYILSDGAVMGANLTLDYLMGTSRKWSFTLVNNLFNNSFSN